MITFTVHSDAEGINALAASASPNDLSGNRHRQLIGWIGIVLPLVLIGLALWRDGWEQVKNLESISAYYYSGGVAAFLGMLVALALFLFAYRGYKDTDLNKYNWADRAAAMVAAGSAIVVAFFPTMAPKGVVALLWWKSWVGVLHHVAAFVLFAMFAIFALWLFRLKPDGKRGLESWRDRVYLVCGVMIVVCIVWAGYNGWNGLPIFWPESFALLFFSASWLVKGYAPRKLGAMVASVPKSS